MPDDATLAPSYALLHDVARMLALIAQACAPLDNSTSPSAASPAPHQMAHLSPAPAVEPATRLRFLVSLLQAANLIAPAGGALRLAKTAYRWLDEPPADQIAALRHAWFAHLALTWRALPVGREQPGMALHWQSVTLAALDIIATLPADDLLSVADLAAGLALQGILDPPGPITALPVARRALARRGQRLVALLGAYILPGLALVRIADAQPTPAFAPTPEGGVWLRDALARRAGSPHRHHPPLAPMPTATEIAFTSPDLRLPAAPPPWVRVNAVQAAAGSPMTELEVALPLTAPAGLAFELLHFAELLVPDPTTPNVTRYRLTPATLRRGLVLGYPPADVTLLLTLWQGVELPGPLLHLLDTWRDTLAHVTCEPGYCFTFADAATLTGLRRQPIWRRHARPGASGRHAWVAARQAAGLIRRLAESGYVLNGAPTGPAGETTTFAHPSAPQLPTPIRAALPLLPLAVALATYQALRTRLPGLSQLELQPLAAAIEAALTPAEQVALRTLTASHTALLAATCPAAPAAPTAGPPPAASQRNRLLAAIAAGQSVELLYADTQARVTRRRVWPLHLTERGGFSYLVARCELRQDERHFRLDRILTIQ